MNFQKSQQVHQTTDYSKFKNIGGNRTKNLSHINRLKQSMSENYLFTVILVNEKLEIIDGQHRFEVIQELKLPLYYVIQEGYSLNEVHILNQNAKNWTSEDYLEGYCDLGYDDYLKFKAFKEKYKLTMNSCLTLLVTGNSNNVLSSFKNGEINIGNYALSCDRIEKILSVSRYYEGVRRRTFIGAMVSLLKNKNFSFDVFMNKLKRQPTSLVDCVNVETTIELIEKIYNNKNRNKVNLRF